MGQDKALEIIEHINSSYNKQLKLDQNGLKMWQDELSKYDFDEVLDNFKRYAANDTYGKIPTLYQLTTGLTQVASKLDYSKQIVYCPLCHKAMNTDEEMKHRERCSSVRYIVRKVKEYGIPNCPSMRDLYNMSQEEFDEKYDKVLKFIYKRTTNLTERMIIGKIFNEKQ